MQGVIIARQSTSGLMENRKKLGKLTIDIYPHSQTRQIDKAPIGIQSNPWMALTDLPVKYTDSHAVIEPGSQVYHAFPIDLKLLTIAPYIF